MIATNVCKIFEETRKVSPKSKMTQG